LTAGSSSKVWSIEAIERRMKLKKERRMLERQVEELKTLYAREMNRYRDDEENKEK